MEPQEILGHIKDALRCEADAITAANERVGQEIVNAVEILNQCKGRLIITGMGKAGLIGQKAAATFSSTGAPAIFLHPVEALHGDMGIVTRDDVLLALSNSGTTEEVITLLAYMKRWGNPIIGLTGRADSPLAQHSDVVIDTSVEREADPIDVAPTASSTVALAMCDALAIALMHVKGFTSEQFAEFHPGGNLGKQLLTKVSDLMHEGDSMPQVSGELTLREAIVVISRKALGCTFVVDDQQKLQGILTDGDLRRVFEKHDNPLDDSVAQHMTKEPTQISPDAMAAEALHIMEVKSINVLPVVKDDQTVGIIHLHDLLRAGLA